MSVDSPVYSTTTWSRCWKPDTKRVEPRVCGKMSPHTWESGHWGWTLCTCCRGSCLEPLRSQGTLSHVGVLGRGHQAGSKVRGLPSLACRGTDTCHLRLQQQMEMSALLFTVKTTVPLPKQGVHWHC